MFLFLILSRLVEINAPALEKILSEGTDVPGMHKYFKSQFQLS